MIDESNRLKGWTEPWKALDEGVAELQAMVELLEEEDDPDLEAEFAKALATHARDLAALELKTMLQGDDDHREALVTIHPGAVGRFISRQLTDFLARFRAEGSTLSQLDRMSDFETQNAIVGLPEMLEMANRYRG